MDLIICQPVLERGGVERQILELAKRFTPIIYTTSYSPKKTYSEFSEFDVRVIKGGPAADAIGYSAKFDSDPRMKNVASAGAAFYSFKIKEDYDAINAHLMPSEWVRNRNERVAWYCHCPCRPAYGWEDYYMQGRSAIGKLYMKSAIIGYRLIESSVVPKIESICANSKFSSANISKYLHRDDSHVIYPGVDPKAYDISGYDHFFFYPSRIVPEKQMEMAIVAFRKFGRKSWRLVIGGHLDPTPRNLAYLEELKAASKGLPVTIVPNMTQKQLAHYYSNCYVTLFAGMREDWGLVPVESMASGKPCISTNDGGPKESIVDGKTGFLVNTVDEMAEKMKFLADNPYICEQMGKAGRKRVEQNYTWKIFLDKMEKVFKETANRINNGE